MPFDTDELAADLTRAPGAFRSFVPKPLPRATEAGPALSPVAFDKKAVRKALNKFAGDMGDVLLDNTYYALTRKEWKAVVAAVGTDGNAYTPEKYDCDSFSRYWWAEVNHRFEVNGMFVVVDYSGAHSYNALLVHNGSGKLSVRLFEPQNGSYPKFGVKPYSLKSGFFM